jgi:hypothetical protein
MLTWLDGRNGSSFGSLSWDGTSLGFRVTAGTGATGLRGMVPARFGGDALESLTRDGSAVAFTREAIKGVDYGMFPATSGSYVARYASDTTAPQISAVAATSTASGTATVTWTTDEASDSKVLYGTSPATLDQTASDGANVTSHRVTLTGLTGGTTYSFRVQSARATARPRPPRAMRPRASPRPSPPSRPRRRSRPARCAAARPRRSRPTTRRTSR